jgi:hypothetical protein
VKGLFPIRRMKDVLNDACKVGLLRMILLQFEMFESNKTCIKYGHIVRPRFGSISRFEV